MHRRIPQRFRLLLCLVLAVVLMMAPGLFAASGSVDVKVTDDNNNVDGGLAAVTPSKDARNRQANETTVAISPMASPVTGTIGDIIAASANDYRMVPWFGDTWMPVYLSFDGGATWFGAPPSPNGFNTMVPGFPNDTSAAGLASPIHNLDAAGDPVVRFDAAGNLYVAGIAFNRNFDQPDRPVDNVVFVTKYSYTPGSSATASTNTSAGAPPHFTYAGTTIVDRGAVGFSVPPNQPFGFAGIFVDKEWMEIDTNSAAASPCAGSVYVAFSTFRGLAGGSAISFSRSTNGGASFSRVSTISTGGQAGSRSNQGSDIAVAPNGTVYVVYQSDAGNTRDPESIHLVRSTNCGRSWSQPVVVGTVTTGQAPGVAFRTPTFAFVATDSTDSNTVYVAYQNLVAGDYNIYVQRSTDGGRTWSSATRVNDVVTRHQVFPTIEVSNHALHVAWYDFRNSTTAGNEALDVYYSCTNCESGTNWPNFIAAVRVSDVSHQANCLMFGGGTVAFHGDYIELDARWDGAHHIVHVAWADNRDVPAAQCDLDPAPGPASNNIGNRNQNIYADTLTVNP